MNMSTSFIFIYCIFGMALHSALAVDHNLLDSYLFDKPEQYEILQNVLNTPLQSGNRSITETEGTVNVIFEAISGNCSSALDYFTQTVLQFTRCSILNARPIRICRSCGKELNATKNAYEDLKSESVDCQRFLFESDQVGIIDKIYNEAEDLWNKSYCQNCFINQNYTQNFFNISDQLDSCILNSNKSAATNGTCKDCQELFGKLNGIYSYFVQKQSEFDRGICMDIVDKMNVTRRLWSEYRCMDFNTHIGYPNIVTAILVGTMPVFFYLLARNVSIIEDVKIVRPKRKSFASIPNNNK